ncbi:MAG: 5-(carboxyamino)imidazole ribonucleotide synthase [Betaproteobacteria bacterium]|nr:5-(carboxyamino)imidazole ribonucleotide synthase [Betaproteobacteria bacterium]
MPTISPILPPATLGLLGGGQLGRFFVAAAHELGYTVWVLDPDPHSPAGKIADRHLQAPYEDSDALKTLAEHCAAVTTEFENVPANTLETLAKSTVVHPSAQAVSICQNRIDEKNFLRAHGLPCGEFAAILSAADLDAAAETLFPGILKAARFGYDGKGQAFVANRAEARAAWAAMNAPAVLEKRLKLDYEISVVLARMANGEVCAFPASENTHRNGILDVSLSPPRRRAGKHDAICREAAALAEKIAVALSCVGTMAVEFFVSEGRLLVNEIAPRPHNSGHFTLDACVTNQFEQQVRALCGLPPGSPRAHTPSAMVNLLGDLWYDGGNTREPDWSKLLQVPNLALHLYGKHQARPGRKMGHFTVLDADPQRACDKAMAARAAIGIED